MAGIVYTKLLDALKSIGVDVSQQQGSNVKKLAPKNKSTATKPGLLASERDSGGNFGTVLDIFKDEAKYIDSMNDAEQMAFLNNILDYNEFGGKSIGVSKGIETTDAMKDFKKTQLELKKALEDLNTNAKTMKDDAEAGLASAEKDLKDFLDTGGQPLKAKSDKYLGGSMHEEGQIRTGIRQFLQNELKNGRIKLDSMDKERVMKYFPTLEDDPILVFKKIYGDEAYNKAGSFPGAFEIGEDFNHYRKIFEEKMGPDLLKVKDKKYVGDGTLMLTDEVYEPKPDVDDDIPFAKGGIADFRIPFASGKVVTSIIEYLTTKFSPMEAMKEINKVIGKTGKYKNLKLTQKDIDKIVEDTNDFIFQRDPDNLYVYDDGTTVFDDGLTKEQLIEKESRAMDKADEMNFEDSIKEMEGLGATQTAERFKLKQKYPGITDDLLNKILIDDNPQRKAEVLATIDEAFKMMEKGKGTEEIIETFKNTTRTKNAKGGRAGFLGGGSVIKLLDGTTVQIPAGSYGKYGLKDYIYSSSRGDLTKDEIIPLLVPAGASYATGGRAGFYLGGQSGQSVIEPDLSDIGHGSDALMSRTRMLGPNSQATTSTGLNYLLGEDNDNTRVPFNEGLSVPPAKPYTEDMFEKDSMTLLKGMYGTGPDSNKFLYNEMIKKGNILRNQGVERETVIEIIRNNKDKINAFLETQTTTPKSLKGMAKGGRIGFAGGGADMSTVADSQGNVGATSVDVSPSGQVTTSTTKGPDSPDDRGTSEQNINHRRNMIAAQNKPNDFDVVVNAIDTANTLNKGYNFLQGGGLKSLFNFNPYALGAMTLTKIAQKNKRKKDAYEDSLTEEYANGGIAGLRQGYAGGSLVDKGRRGFLKFLGGTAAGVVALKTGLAKLLGKESGAISKKALDEVIIEGGSGAPAWLQPLVNKALREGTDKTKSLAYKDAQTVKSLDTPTGKVDVYYDVRTGEVEIDYIGGNTALGESVNMRYTPGIVDEGTKGVKPMDEFEASEAIPEGQMSSPNDYNVELGENVTGDVKELYSDTSELAELGGEKLLIKDISTTIKKKKVLKQMNENPDKFASDNLRDDFPDYDYGDVNPDYD